MKCLKIFFFFIPLCLLVSILYTCAFLARVFSTIAEWSAIASMWIVINTRSIFLLKIAIGIKEETKNNVEDIEVKEE